jgi:cell division protein DivIC
MPDFRLKRLKNIFSKVPAVFKTRYALAIGVFLVWMLFFDNFNVIRRAGLQAELIKARKQRNYYKEEMVRIRAEMEELFTNDASLEKFARERYLMKRPDEDIFIILPNR